MELEGGEGEQSVWGRRGTAGRHPFNSHTRVYDKWTTYTSLTRLVTMSKGPEKLLEERSILLHNMEKLAHAHTAGDTKKRGWDCGWVRGRGSKGVRGSRAATHVMLLRQDRALGSAPLRLLLARLREL